MPNDAALIRNNKAGIAAFRLANGYAGLRDALGSDSVRFQRFRFSISPIFSFLLEYCSLGYH